MGPKAKQARNKRALPSIRSPQDSAHSFGDLGDDYDATVLASSQHWAVIWGRAIAMAWTDPAYKRKLLDPTTTRDAIERDLGYKLNEGLELVIEEDQGATYMQGARDPWRSLKKHKLTMYLPPAPPVAQQAIALAEYADTGRSYPFTSL